jgi:hypothetical protein
VPADLPQAFSGVARGFPILFLLVVVAGGWPSKLIAIMSLGSPLLGAYFTARLHKFFKPKAGILSWSVPSEVASISFPEGVGLLVLGSLGFIAGVLSGKPTNRRLIALVVIRLCGSTLRGLCKDRATAKDMLSKQGLRPTSLLDMDIGGAMDASYVLGFGGDLGLDLLPVASRMLPCTLRHFLDGGTTSFFPETSWVARSSIPEVDGPPWKVLWHKDVVLGMGLFPCSRSLLLVYCPSHFFLHHWVCCSLSSTERLRLHQLPLAMDTALRELSPTHVLPFEDSPPPNLFVSVF